MGTRVAVAVLLALVAAGGISVLVMTAARGDRVPSAAPALVAAPVDPAVVRACEVAVARARAAVAAAQPSYSHWSSHVRAQVDFDNGTATLDQTRARWDATRATADADLAGFAAAWSAYEPVRHGCDPRPAAAPTVPDPVMGTCATEFVAASTAAVAGKAVVDDWAAHVAMMKGREHFAPDQYGQEWRDMVKAAPANLARFADASLQLRDHVDCPRPS